MKSIMVPVIINTDEKEENMMYDVLIIGAGIVGTAIARRLSRYQLSVC